MLDHKHYVPILKGKKGEFEALRELEPSVKSRITPLIEIAPIDWDYDNDVPRKTIDDHLSGVADKIMDAWQQDRPVFLDFPFLEPSVRMSSGDHFLTHVLEDARRTGIFGPRIIPVIDIGSDAGYRAAVSEALEQDNLGACLRLKYDDLDEDDLDVRSDELLNQIGAARDEVDLILDFEAIPEDYATFLARSIRTHLNNFPRIAEWRSLVIAASAFPQSLSSFERNTIGFTNRAE